MYKFVLDDNLELKIASKEFNSEYQIISTIDLNKIRLSEGVGTNKHDTRHTIGYEVGPGKIVPFYIKTPKDCISLGVSQYNESSPWKMGFNVSKDEAWILQYEGIWNKVEELLRQKLKGTPVNNGKYINPKLITWDGEIRTRFKGNSWGKPENIGSCYATGILRSVGSVYRQGSNYYLQVFLKECKYMKRDTSFKS